MRQYGTAKAAEAANAVPFFAANAPMQMLRCECSDVNAPNDYMRSNAGHNHLKINKGGGTFRRRTVFNFVKSETEPSLHGRCSAGVKLICRVQ